MPASFRLARAFGGLAFTGFAVVSLSSLMLGGSYVPAVAEPTPFPSLPPCTEVIVSTTEPVDSGKAKPGDFFKFKSVGAVTLHGKVIIPTGTMGYGVVTVAIPAGKGHGGALGLEPLYFEFSDGRKLHVVRDRRPSSLNGQGASGQLPGYLGAVPVPGVGLALGAFNSLHKGKNVTIAIGTLGLGVRQRQPGNGKVPAQG